jgi:histidinol-phosphatase
MLKFFAGISEKPRLDLVLSNIEFSYLTSELETVHQPTEFLDFALDLSRIAAARIMPHYRHHTVSWKADGTEVTAADQQAELALRQAIEQRYSDHQILGEEFGCSGAAGARYCWVLDPVDGTTWFTLGVPLFGTLIALLDHGDPIVGVIHLPAIQETIYAARATGCWFQANGEAPVQVQVQPDMTLEQAFVCASGVHSSDVIARPGETPYQLSALIHQAQRFRFCSDCSQYALVCRGNVAAAMDAVVKPWDIAAIVPCIEEAGGVITSLGGDRQNIISGGSLLASCGERLHQEILGVLNSI